MSRAKREKHRSNRGGRTAGESPNKPTAAMVAPEFHVTVATVPAGDIADGLVHDAALVKAALLYADRVTLASAAAVMFGSLTGFTTPDLTTRRKALEATLFALPGHEHEDAVGIYEDLQRRRKSLTRIELQALIKLDRAFKTGGDELADTTQRLLDEAGMPELQQAIDAGVLDIHLLDLKTAQPEEFASEAVEGLANVLAEAVSARARTYPMFDDGAGNLVNSMLAEGVIATARPGHSQQAGAAGLLIGQLEAFPDATMDVVLDVRAKLKPSLTRFRTALAEASSEFEAPAWQTHEFAREVDDLYRRRVSPALLDLEEAMDELRARPSLRRLAADVENLKSTAAIAVSAVAAMDLSHLPHAVFGSLGAFATAASATARERDYRAEARSQQQANGFYFLYDANRQLSR